MARRDGYLPAAQQGQIMTDPYGRNSRSLSRRAQADANWAARITIGNKSRTLTDWLGRMFDSDLSECCSYGISSISQRRRELNIPAFSGDHKAAAFEIASVRTKRLKDAIHGWACRRPKGIAEYVREITWKKLLKQYGETA